MWASLPPADSLGQLPEGLPRDVSLRLPDGLALSPRVAVGDHDTGVRVEDGEARFLGHGGLDRPAQRGEVGLHRHGAEEALPGKDGRGADRRDLLSEDVARLPEGLDEVAPHRRVPGLGIGLGEGRGRDAPAGGGADREGESTVHGGEFRRRPFSRRRRRRPSLPRSSRRIRSRDRCEALPPPGRRRGAEFGPALARGPRGQRPWSWRTGGRSRGRPRREPRWWPPGRWPAYRRSPP